MSLSIQFLLELYFMFLVLIERVGIVEDLVWVLGCWHGSLGMGRLGGNGSGVAKSVQIEARGDWTLTLNSRMHVKLSSCSTNG